MRKIKVPWKKYGFKLWHYSNYYSREIDTRGTVLVARDYDNSNLSLYINFSCILIDGDNRNNYIYVYSDNNVLKLRNCANKTIEQVHIPSWDRLFNGRDVKYDRWVKFSLDTATQEDVDKFMEEVVIFCNDLAEFCSAQRLCK
jgi:hypothetical protein